MIEIVSVLVALCLISLVLRVFARIRRRVGFGVDDYLSMLSMVLLIGMLIELIFCKYCSTDWNLFHPNGYHRVCNWRQWSPYRGSIPRYPRELLEGTYPAISNINNPT